MLNIFMEFQKGGPWMYPIALVGIAALVIVIERMYALMFRYNIDGARFINEIRKYVMANDIAGAINYCNKEPELAICRVVKSGLTKANRTKGEIREAVNEAILEVMPGLEKGLGFLPAFANISTLLGLLGTVSGLIASFAATQATDPASRALLLAGGIAEAMHCTAFGLIIAIPTLFFHSFLHRKSVRIIDDVDQASVKLINMLSGMPGQDAKG